MENELDDKENEIHHLQFVEQDGTLPLSISILIRYKRGGQSPHPLSDEDLAVIEEALTSFTGSIKPLLTKKSV